MTMRHADPHLRRHLLVAAALLAMLACAPALAVNITIGGVNIGDLPGNARDLDGPGNDTITFNSIAAGAAGFALPGYNVSGKVKIGPGGALGGVGFASIVSLTEFTATRVGPLAAGAAPLVITFGHTFPAPAGAQFAADKLSGTVTHAGAVNIGWQGKVNGAAIVLPAGANVVAFPAAAGGVNVNQVNGGHGLMGIPPPGGPPWTLTGELSISLGAAGDVLTLPTSAEVGIGPVPEPGSLAMLAAGLVSVLALRAFKGYSRGRRSWP